jgi:hypothetical protein
MSVSPSLNDVRVEVRFFFARCAQYSVLVTLTDRSQGWLPDSFKEANAMRSRILISALSIVFVVLSSSAHAADPVTVRLKWLNQAQFAGFYVAQEKGYYKSEGLDVNIQPGGPDFPAVQMIAGGNN